MPVHEPKGARIQSPMSDVTGRVQSEGLTQGQMDYDNSGRPILDKIKGAFYGGGEKTWSDRPKTPVGHDINLPAAKGKK